MAYMRSNLQSDMAVRVDESEDIIGVGIRDGKIVPIVRPGSVLTAKEIMAKARMQKMIGHQATACVFYLLFVSAFFLLAGKNLPAVYCDECMRSRVVYFPHPLVVH